MPIHLGTGSVLVAAANANPAAVVQHIHPPEALTPTSLDLWQSNRHKLKPTTNNVTNTKTLMRLVPRNQGLGIRQSLEGFHSPRPKSADPKPESDSEPWKDYFCLL